MDSLVYYYRKQAGRGREDIVPIYSIPRFVQRGHGIGSVLAGLFRILRHVFWCGAKALGRQALRTGGKILTDIAENPEAETGGVISKHVKDSIKKLRGGGGRKRKGAPSAAPRNAKRLKNAPCLSVL
jgi:hypothetical protein